MNVGCVLACMCEFVVNVQVMVRVKIGKLSYLTIILHLFVCLFVCRRLGVKGSNF